MSAVSGQGEGEAGLVALCRFPRFAQHRNLRQQHFALATRSLSGRLASSFSRSAMAFMAVISGGE